MKKTDVAKKMSSFTPNPPGVMEKNNRLMMKIDKHNRSWNGKEYSYGKKKGKASLNPVQKSKDNMVMEHKNEVENN